jgi:hypothetical protein
VERTRSTNGRQTNSEENFNISVKHIVPSVKTEEPTYSSRGRNLDDDDDDDDDDKGGKR